MIAMPIAVPAATTSNAVRSVLEVRRAGPNRRSANAMAPSTANTKTGRTNVDSRNQLANGSDVRSMAPATPRSATIQKPSA